MATGQLYTPLQWAQAFQYPGMVAIRTIPDGSSYFHAIANACFIPYRTGEIKGRPVSRSEIVQGMRHDLSLRLRARSDPQNPQSMQAQLNSSQPVDNSFNEFISNELGKDIYILDGTKQDVYVTGKDDVYVTGKDDDILYKNRPSIVILYRPGHYELVGLMRFNEPQTVDTLFAPSHPFIQTIRRRLAELRGN